MHGNIQINLKWMDFMITSIKYYYGPQKKKPRVGDRKMIRGLLHERVFRTINGMIDHCNGRYHYDWKPVMIKEDTSMEKEKE